MAKATTSLGMTAILLDKKSGCAVRRKWFGSLASMKAWFDWQYPSWQENYDLEILYDKK